MSELERPGAEPVVEGGTRDRGPIIVVTAISLSRAAREALAERLGPGHLVRDIREAENTADIVLVPSVSSMLVGSLRATFPGAKVLVTELVDDEFGVDFAGPVTRTVSSGVDGYFVVPDLSQLASITREVGRGSAGALTSGSSSSGNLALTAEAPTRDSEADSGDPGGRQPVGSGPRTPTLVLSGPPGAGKTAVAWRIFDQWTAAQLDPALVDLDLLGAARPAPADDPRQRQLKAKNLASVWANFRAAGSRCLVVAAVVESADDRDLIRAAVGDRVIVCRLHTCDAVRAHRVASDFTVDVDGASVDEVSDRVLASLRHLLSTVR